MATTVHVLGVGNMGGIVASALANLARPPAVTLLLRSQERVNVYNKNAQGQLTIRRLENGSSVDLRTKIPASCMVSGPIRNLIVGTKVPQTIPALSNIASNITAKTNILFLQNGMGLYETLCETLWQNSAERPNMIFSTSTHGVRSIPDITFGFNHNGPGDLKVSLAPRKDSPANLTADNALVALLLESTLNTIPLPYDEFIIAQFEKLMINCTMNALTGLYNCVNGELLDLQSLDYLLHHIVSESINAFKAYLADSNIPISIPQDTLDNHYFNTDAFCEYVRFIIHRNAKSTTSMVQDIAALRDTEIDNINGYIVHLAKQHGTSAPHNSMIVELIKSKLSLDRARDQRKHEK